MDSTYFWNIKIYDNLILIPAMLINFNNKISDITKVINKIGNKKSVIIESKSMNINVEKIVNILGFFYSIQQESRKLFLLC